MSRANPRHWLITAFEPFAGRPENNSVHVLNEIKKLEASLGGTEGWNFQFHYFILPVVYETCFPELQSEVMRLQKSGVKLEGILGLGEAHEEFKLETQANNLNDVAELADNSGVRREAKKIFDDLDLNVSLPLRLPLEAFARIRTSQNPGYFICNHLCAHLSRTYGSSQELPYFGFIHVPKVGSGGMFTADVCAAMIVNSFKKMKI